ncbi:hypothetical protein YW5DRAFT_03773 [Streptomyces sp. Ncost-T6T-1]|nr:hypothetical protein YW5DRAFT_03773 [Streptomyces sp. Ncost-T6T-1]
MGEGFAGAVGAAAGGLDGLIGPCGFGGSDVWRCSTGMAAAAGGTAPGADGTTPAGPSVPAGLAPAGISRSGLPRAGRTASGAGRSGVEAGPEDGGAGRSGAIDRVRSGAIDRVRSGATGPLRSGPLRCSDAARWTVAGAAVDDAAEKGVGATGVAGAAGASAVICRSGMAGRRATVSDGAIRSGRTAAGRDGGRTAASALLPGPSVGRPGAGRAPVCAAEPTEPDGPDEPAERTEPDDSGEPDEAPEPTESDEPDRSEELDEVADPAADGFADADPAAFAGPDTDPDTDPDRAAFELPDASLDASPDRAESADPAELAVPDAAVRPVEAAERDTYTVPGVPADDDRFAGPEAPDEDWFPDDWPPGPGAPDDAPDLAPEAPADDRDVAPEARDDDRSAGSEARDDDRLVAPAAPDDDRLPPEAADRWTGGDAGPGFPVPVPVPRADALPAEADGRSAAGPRGSAGSSASAGRTARSSSGPPGDAEGRAEPGRATPWMRPTGADGRTAWPSSPPRDGFCHEARRERNRSPSLTPIEDRATVTDGGATRRHPPSQPPSPSPRPSASLDTAGVAGTAEVSPCPLPPSGEGTADRRRSVRRSQSPNPTRSPAFVDAGVDPRYLPHPLLTLAVGEVENVLTLPMEVVGDVRDLLPQPGKRVRHDSPRRPPERSTSNEPWHSGQVTAACVWPSLLIRR